MSRGEHVLRQVVANGFSTHITFEEFFVIDESLPGEMARQIADGAERAVALDCWANMMHAAVDAVANRYKNEVL